jgi:hypothetical protein
MVSQETNADTNLVPAITEARRAVCGLQFQRVCETEDSRFIPRAQGCAEPEGDPGIDAEGFERAAGAHCASGPLLTFSSIHR